MFSSYYICHSEVLDQLEIENFCKSLLISIRHSFSTKTLVTIVELYFCGISPEQLFQP